MTRNTNRSSSHVISKLALMIVLLIWSLQINAQDVTPAETPVSDNSGEVLPTESPVPPVIPTEDSVIPIETLATESPSEVPTTAPATEIPSDVPVIPTLEAPIESPTIVPTPEVVPDVTESPTPDVEETALPEPPSETLTPAETADPAALPLAYSETFDTGFPPHLSGKEGWTDVVLEGGNKALQNQGAGGTALYNAMTFTEVDVQARVFLKVGTFSLIAHHSDAGAYSAVFDASGTVSLISADSVLNTMDGVSLPLETWTTVRLSVIGDTLTAFVDGGAVISAQSSLHSTGRVGFAAGEGAMLRVDDFAISGTGTIIDVPIPTEMPLAEAVMPAAAPPVPTILTPTANQIFGAVTSLTIDWDDAAGATSYSVEISTATKFTPLVLSQADVSESQLSVNLSALPGDGKYYTRVRAGNAGVMSGYSRTVAFVIDTTPPRVPTKLSAPAANADVALARPRFSWASVPEASTYHIQIDRAETFDTPLLIDKVIKGTSYTIPADELPLAQGIWYLRIAAIDAVLNESDYSDIRMFTVNLMSQPAQNAHISVATPSALSTIRFQWAGVTGVTGYVIELDIDNTPDFLGTLRTCSTAAANKLTCSITDVPTGQHAWRVLINGQVPSATHPFRTLFVSPARPSTPVLQLPLAKAILGDSSVPARGALTFDWSDVKGYGSSVRFLLEVASTTNFAAPLEFVQSDITASLLENVDLSHLAEGLHYWRVTAINEYGLAGKPSAVRSFTIDSSLPAAPTVVSPLCGSTTSTNPPTFRWESIPGAKRYEVIWDITDPTTKVPDTVTGTSFKPSSPLITRSYTVRLKAFDSANNSSGEGTPCVITIISSPSSVPVLNRYVGTANLSWAPLSRTDPTAVYEVEIDNHSNFSSPEYRRARSTNNALPSNTSSVSVDLPGGSYWWRLRVCGPVSCGKWSSVGRLTVDK